MKRYKSKFEEGLNLSLISKSGRLQNISLNFININSGLYKTTITINGSTMATGIFDSDDTNILEKALEIINSKIEKS